MASKINITTNWNELNKEQQLKLQKMFARIILSEKRKSFTEIIGDKEKNRR